MLLVHINKPGFLGFLVQCMAGKRENNNYNSPITLDFGDLSIGHFTVMCLVTWP